MPNPRNSTSHPDPEFLSPDSVWPTLRQLAKETRAPKRIASAYIGVGAATTLQLRRKDTLLVALSEANVRNGSVSPEELLRLRRLGVALFTQSSLHAKVYSFENAAVVGSANLSISSGSRLKEAALLTRKKSVINSVNSWFDRSCTTPVTEAHLKTLAPLFPKQRQRAPGRNHDERERLWLVSMNEMEFPENEDAAYEKGETCASAAAPRNIDLESLRFSAKTRFLQQVKRGDLLIQVFKHNRLLSVYPHAPILHVEQVPGGTARYVFVEKHKRPARSWAEFRKVMKEHGCPLPQHFNAREVPERALDIARELTRPTR